MSEVDAIRKRYAQRDAKTSVGGTNLIDRFALIAGNDRRYQIRNAIASHFAGRQINELSLIDIGCGGGATLLQMVDMGLNPAKMCGIELTKNRADHARNRVPGAIRILEGDATVIDVEDAPFDIVQQSTVFTSILDDAAQEALARRMWQLVKPGGLILWYDFMFDNPANKDVRAVKPPRIRELFPEAQIEISRITLAPPIARRALKLGRPAYAFFNAFPFLRSHVFARIEKGKNQ